MVVRMLDNVREGKGTGRVDISVIYCVQGCDHETSCVLFLLRLGLSKIFFGGSVDAAVEDDEDS